MQNQYTRLRIAAIMIRIVLNIMNIFPNLCFFLKRIKIENTRENKCISDTMMIISKKRIVNGKKVEFTKGDNITLKIRRCPKLS